MKLYQSGFQPCASVSKRVFVKNLSDKNEIYLHENDPVRGTDTRMNGYTFEDSFWYRGKGQLGNGLLRWLKTVAAAADFDVSL